VRERERKERASERREGEPKTERTKPRNKYREKKMSESIFGEGNTQHNSGKPTPPAPSPRPNQSNQNYNTNHNNSHQNNNNNTDNNDLSPLFAMKDLLERKLRSLKDFTKAVIYSDDGTVIVSTFEVKQKEILDLLPIFNDNDTAFENGVDIDSDHYDVHRFYDRYLYGRKGEGGLTGTGFALIRTLRNNGRYIFALITFGFPTISAKAVTTLAKFANENLANF